MAKDFSKILNVANDFYNGAVKGTKKANHTINRVASKNNIAKNLDVTKTISKSKKVIGNNAPNMKIKANKINDSVRLPVNKPTAAMKAGDWAGGGIRDSYKNYKKSDDGIMKSIQKGHMKADQKTYDMGKIAGTTFSVGVAGRIATGGGLYKDRYGNTNLPGVPFI